MVSDFVVECGFGHTPTDSNIRWTDVSGRFRSITGRDGRNTELDRVEVGQATIVLDNADGRWTPGREWLASVSESFASVDRPEPSSWPPDPFKRGSESGYVWGATPVVGLTQYEVLPEGGVRITSNAPTGLYGPCEENFLLSWQPEQGKRYRARAIARALRGTLIRLRALGGTSPTAAMETLHSLGEQTVAASGRWDVLTALFTPDPDYPYGVLWIEALGSATLDVLMVEIAEENPLAGQLIPGLPVRAYNVMDGNRLHFAAVNPVGAGEITPRWHSEDGEIDSDMDGDGPYFALTRGAQVDSRTAIFRAGVDGNSDLIQVDEGDEVVINADVRVVEIPDFRIAAEFVGRDGSRYIDTTVPDGPYAPAGDALGGIATDFTSATWDPGDFPWSWGNYTVDTSAGTLSIEMETSYAGIDMGATLDLTDRQVVIRTESFPADGNGSIQATLMVYENGGSGELAIVKQGGRLEAFLDGVLLSGEPFDAREMRWWRIRESGGQVWYEYSADGGRWTILHRVASPAWVTTSATATVYGGYWGTEPDPGPPWVISHFGYVPAEGMPSDYAWDEWVPVRATHTAPLDGWVRPVLVVGPRIVRESFHRTNPTGWGSILPGPLTWWFWQSGATNASHSMVGGVGIHTINSTSAFLATYIDEVRLEDAEVRVKFQPQLSDITGAAIEPANLIARLQDTDNYWFLRVSIDTAERIYVQARVLVNGAEWAYGSPTDTGLTFTPGDWLAAAFKVAGNRVSGKVWKVGSAEPDWQVTVNNPAQTVTGAGACGIRTGVAGGNTNVPVTIHYDDFEIWSAGDTGSIHVKNVKVRVNDPDTPGEVSGMSGVVPVFRGYAERLFAEQDGKLSNLRLECVDTLGLLATPAPSYYRMVAMEQARIAVEESGARSAYYWPCVEDADAERAHAAYGDVAARVIHIPNSDGEIVGGFVSESVFSHSDGSESGALDTGGGGDKSVGSHLLIKGSGVDTVMDERGFEIAMWVKWKSFPDGPGADGRSLVVMYAPGDFVVGKLEVGGNPGDQRLTFWWYGDSDLGPTYWSSGVAASARVVENRPYLIRCGIRRVPGGVSAVFVAVNDTYSENPVAFDLADPTSIVEIHVGWAPTGAPALVGLGYTGHVDALISHVYLVNGLVGVPFWKDSFERFYDNGLGHAGEIEGAPVLAVLDRQTYEYGDPTRWRVRNGRAEVAPASPGTPELLAIGRFDELGPTDFGGTFRVGTTVPLSSITNGVALRVYARQRKTLDQSTGLTLELRFASNGAVSIGAAVNNVTPSVVSTGRTVTSSTPADVWVRFQIRGRLIRVAFWENGQPAPGPDAWDLSSLISGGSTPFTGYTVIFGFVAGSLPEQWLMWMDDLDLWGSDYWGSNLAPAWARHVDAFLEAVGPSPEGNTGWVASEADRIRAVLRHFGWPMGALIDDAKATLIAARWNNDTPWLQILQDAAEWAGGVFLGGPAGEVAYHNSDHRTGTNRWQLAEFQSGEWLYDLARVANVVRCERSTGAVRIARNEASVARYGERPVTIRRDVADEDQLQAMATAHANAYGDAHPWCEQIAVEGTTATDTEELRALALGGAIGDAVRLIGLPSAAPDTVADAFIEGRQFFAEVDGSVLKWNTTFTVSPDRS